MRILIVSLLLLIAWPSQAMDVQGCYTQGTITSAPAWKSDRVRFFFLVSAVVPEKAIPGTPQSVCDRIVGKSWPVELFFGGMPPDFARTLRANKELMHKDARLELVYTTTTIKTGRSERPSDSDIAHWAIPFSAKR